MCERSQVDIIQANMDLQKKKIQKTELDIEY